MNGLMSGNPSPAAARLAVAATILSLLQLGFVLNAPAVTGGLRLVTWIVALVVGAAFTLALVGRWPPETRSWRDRHDG